MALHEFRELVVKYFSNLEPGLHSWERPHETETATIARSEINRRMSSVGIAISDAGIPTSMRIMEGAALGGRSFTLNLIDDMFDLRTHQVSPQNVIDAVERALGWYEADVAGAWRRTLNPLYWLSRFAGRVASIPFTALENAGLSGKKLEATTLGRLARFLVELATSVFALLSAAYGFLKLVGREEWLTRWFK